MTTEQVCYLFIKPKTFANNGSFIDQLSRNNPAAVGKANAFISHAWLYKFVDVKIAIEQHFKDQPDTVVWFDTFCNN